MILDVRSILLSSMGVSMILTVMMLVYRLTRKVYSGFTHWLMGGCTCHAGIFAPGASWSGF